MADEQRADHPAKVRWDPTINLGHVLTGVTFLTAGLALYIKQDARITALEERSVAQTTLSAERNTQQGAALNEIKTDVKKISEQLTEVRVQVKGRGG